MQTLERFVGFLSVAVSAFVVILSSNAVARPPEPGSMDPIKDAAYISTLGLATQDWREPIVNILIVGQDLQTEFHKGLKYTRPNGEKTSDQMSHADGNMLLSFNKVTGAVSIISIYRGYLVHDEEWNSADEAPKREVRSGLTNQYLANYYLYAGRAKYLDYIRSAFEGFIRSRRLEKLYFANDRLKIHGMIEADFNSFKAATSQFIDYFTSSASILWSMKGSAGQLIGMFANREALLAELRSQPGFDVMTEKRKQEVGKDPSRAVLGTLRERQRYPAGGYQRAFNQAKFISYVLGLVGYTMAEANYPDFLKEIAIVKSFETLSRTFDMKTFDSNLRMADRNLHMIARTGFNAGESPMYVIQVGTSIASYAIYKGGRFANMNADGFIANLQPDIELIPKPNSCPACLPK